jgi:hypothetical protein
MGDAQTRVMFDFSGDREVQYVIGLPEVGDFVTHRGELWVVRRIEEDQGGGPVVTFQLPASQRT